MTLSFMEDQVTASADAIVGAINKLSLNMARMNDNLSSISDTLEGINDQIGKLQEGTELAETLRITNRELTYIGEGVRKLS